MSWDKHYKGRYVLIEPTDYCNCDCIMCTRVLVGVENPHNMEKGFMDFETFKGIIDGLEFGTEPLAIKLFWIGESLLNPDFKKMLEYASKKIKGKNAYIDLHTNANLLTKEITNYMLTLGDAFPRVTFSIDAINPVTYEKIRRGGALDRVMSNIKYFVEQRECQHLLFPRFIFQFIIMEENARECNEFVDHWSTFLEATVKLNLAEAWVLLSKQRKQEMLEEHGILEKFRELENGTENP